MKFKNSDLTLSEFKKQQSFSCDNGAFLTELAVAGHGILVRTALDTAPLISQGKLIPLLGKHPLEDFGDIYAVVPTKRFLAPRVKAVWDYLTEELVLRFKS